VPAEDDDLAQLLRDPEMSVLANKELPKAVWRDVGLDALRIDPGAGNLQRVFVNIGGKDLQFQPQVGGGDLLECQYPQRIRLLASAAARHPDPQRLIRRMMAQKLRHPLG